MDRDAEEARVFLTTIRDVLAEKAKNTFSGDPTGQMIVAGTIILARLADAIAQGIEKASELEGG